MNIAELVQNQKQFLIEYLEPKVVVLANTLSDILDQPDSIDDALALFTEANEFINLSYVLNASCYQVSSNVTKRQIKTQYRGQDLSARPFLKDIDSKHCYLTESYLSLASLKPCISLVFSLINNDELVGILVLDLDLIKLPLLVSNFANEDLRQIKGDVAIRSGLFNQVRKTSVLDTHIKEVHQKTEILMTQFGVFHIKLHYSASRVTIWQYTDPYKYIVMSIDELLNSDTYLLFPEVEYPHEAIVAKAHIGKLLHNFKYLRFMDEHMYLRAGSINIMNATIGVNFSCDGYHYIPSKEFLNNFDKLYA